MVESLDRLTLAPSLGHLLVTTPLLINIAPTRALGPRSPGHRVTKGIYYGYRVKSFDRLHFEMVLLYMFYLNLNYQKIHLRQKSVFSFNQPLCVELLPLVTR
jgi:hypothetical protein